MHVETNCTKYFIVNRLCRYLPTYLAHQASFPLISMTRGHTCPSISPLTTHCAVPCLLQLGPFPLPRPLKVLASASSASPLPKPIHPLQQSPLVSMATRRIVSTEKTFLEKDDQSLQKSDISPAVPKLEAELPVRMTNCH